MDLNIFIKYQHLRLDLNISLYQIIIIHRLSNYYFLNHHFYYYIYFQNYIMAKFN
jgi:hypothetical protein